jgi:hypothetical protein
VSTKPAAVSAPAVAAQPQAPAPKGRPSRQPPDLQGLGIDPEQAFDPAEAPAAKRPPDPIIFYLSVGAGGVILLFGLYILLETLLFRPPSTPTPAAPPVAIVTPAPAPPVIVSTPPPPPPEIAPAPAAPPVNTTQPATGPAWMALKPTVPALKPKPITDQMVEASIKKAVAYLKSHFADGKLIDPNPSDIYEGQDALCVYALLQAGLAVDDSELGITDPFMQGLLDHLKQFGMSKNYTTYARSLRASALSVFDREADRDQLEQDRRVQLHHACEGDDCPGRALGQFKLPIWCPGHLGGGTGGHVRAGQILGGCRGALA